MIRKFGSVAGIDNPQGIDIGIGGGSNIKSIQKGTFSINSASPYTVSIAAVDMTKSILLFNHTNKNGVGGNEIVMGKILNSTQLEFTCYTTNVYADVSWTVIEFNNVKSIQRGDITTTTGSFSQAITAVDLNKSILIVSSKYNMASISMQAMYLMSYFSSATAIAGGVFSGSGVTIMIHYQVVEFN